jgi:hypothetical protein
MSRGISMLRSCFAAAAGAGGLVLAWHGLAKRHTCLQMHRFAIRREFDNTPLYLS